MPSRPRLCITGISGFIGHHVADLVLRETNWDVVGLDRIDESSALSRLNDLPSWRANPERTSFVWHDLKSPVNSVVFRELAYCDYVLHLAASTHVDRSISYPLEYVMDNVVGTCNAFEWVRRARPQRVIYFSTDEVFGPAPEDQAPYKEWDRYRSTNPYSASKAGGEELAIAFHNTYKLPILITHTTNVFGERQHWEKFIPNTIRKALRKERVQIHADSGCNKSGSRFYIHAENVARALVYLLEHGEPGDKYNIVGETEVTNLALCQHIASMMGVEIDYEMVDFHSSRPGHDLRYALDGSKLRALGFSYPAVAFERYLERTVQWYLQNDKWLGL